METDTPTPSDAPTEAADTNTAAATEVPTDSADVPAEVPDTNTATEAPTAGTQVGGAKRKRKEYPSRFKKRVQHVRPSSPIVHRPWLAFEAATADLPVQTTLPSKRTRKPREFKWPKGFNLRVYKSLRPGKEREKFLNDFKEKNGVKTKPTSPKMVPKNFAWPKGLSREEFLAKKPGKQRMAFLASYIKKNGIDLEKSPVAPRRPSVPIGRQPEPLTHPRCGCSSSEACASCSRCVELHCVCGLTGRRRRALCQESRACSCPLLDPATRCKLCHGCRQSQEIFSHCHCVLHQKLLWIKRNLEIDAELTEKEDEEVCNCFVLAHRYGGAAVTKKKEAKALKEIERVRRIKRSTGFPSSDNIYRSNKVTTFLGDEGLESDFDDGVEDGPVSEVLPPSTESVIPRTMTSSMVDHEYNPASYHPLFRSEGCSLLETIEPRSGRINQMGTAAFASDAIQDEICRGLDNFAYETDRNATMPPDDMVDFLVYMASIKAANVGELIGTFEDSAAVAGSIVIEEYMRQLIEDAIVQQEVLCPPTKAIVQAFTRELLVGFNWKLFEQQQSCSPPLTMDKARVLKDKLAALILREFVSTQPRHLDSIANHDVLIDWIRSTVEVAHLALIDKNFRQAEDQAIEKARRQRKRKLAKRKKVQSLPQIRLSVKANPMHGNPAYKLHYATTLEDGRHLETTVGGVDSKIKAKAMLSQLSKVVERQELRIMGLLKDPPTPPSLAVARPRRRPQDPGPEPVLRPPPTEPDDPYASMFELVWEHVNDFVHRKWKASRDEYLSATARRQHILESKLAAAANRQNTGSQRKEPKCASQ